MNSLVRVARLSQENPLFASCFFLFATLLAFLTFNHRFSLSTMSETQLSQNSPLGTFSSPFTSTSSGDSGDIEHDRYRMLSKRRRIVNLSFQDVVVEHALCVAGVAVTIVDIADRKFVPFYANDSCKWLTNVFGYRWFKKMPVDNTLSRLSAAITKQRGKATRRSRAVDSSGVLSLWLEVDLPSQSVPFKVANIAWPIHVAAEPDVLSTVLKLIRDDLTRATTSHAPVTPTGRAGATSSKPSPAFSASSVAATCTATTRELEVDADAHPFVNQPGDEASDDEGHSASAIQATTSSELAAESAEEEAGTRQARSSSIWQQVSDVVDAASLPSGVIYAPSVPGFIVRRANFLGGKPTRFRCQKPPQHDGDGDGLDDADDGAYVSAVLSEVRRQRQRAVDFLRASGRSGPSATGTGDNGDA